MLILLASKNNKMQINAEQKNLPIGTFKSTTLNETASSLAIDFFTNKQQAKRKEVVLGGRFREQILQVLLLICALAHFGAVTSSAMQIQRRVKRALYELPDGADLVVGPSINTSFTCDGLGYGYYADPDNQCKIFHVCQSFKMSDGSIYNNHWSFMCANQTVFNQVSLACSHPEESVPCENARDFYYVNDYFGDQTAPAVKESDLIAAHELISRAYGSRLSTSLEQ